MKYNSQLIKPKKSVLNFKGKDTDKDKDKNKNTPTGSGGHFNPEHFTED